MLKEKHKNYCYSTCTLTIQSQTPSRKLKLNQFIYNALTLDYVSRSNNIIPAPRLLGLLAGQANKLLPGFVYRNEIYSTNNVNPLRADSHARPLTARPELLPQLCKRTAHVYTMIIIIVPYKYITSANNKADYANGFH